MRNKIIKGHVYLPDYKKIETELHNRYATKHIRGEWFNLNRGDLADLDEELGLCRVE
jgi:hypothetical protein